MSTTPQASDSQIIERCLSVVRDHPNTGPSLGPLKKWLNTILEDKQRAPELRGICKDISRGRTLADKVCQMVERYSDRAGDPWKRNLGKSRDGAPKAKAKPKTTDAPSSGTQEEEWQMAGKNKGKNEPKEKE